jgi:crotonobetainyl-CoA:carnitine CoA-transferase CaiB-like acyl-CoA transferase
VPLPLDGLTVVDLTQVLSGPYCTMLLADMGADVVKIEPPAGDATRQWGPFLREDEERSYGGYFQSVNRNKRGIVLDLKTDDGREVLLEMLSRADVLVENFRVGVMDRLGLAWETLHDRFPRLVYAAIRGFGDPRTGVSPYVDWPAFDIVAQGMGGLVGTTGSDPEHPVKTGPATGDVWPAVLLTVGLLAAVRQAERTGVGDFVDVGMYDGIMSLSERAIYLQTYTGIDPQPQGNTHPMLAPYGIFPTVDGWVSVAAPTDNHWRALARLIGRPELAGDPRFATNEARFARSAETIGLVEAWTSARTTAQVVETLAGQVPCGPVNKASDIVTDPHVAARRMLVDLPQPGADRSVGVAGAPVKFLGAGEPAFRRAPRLGEHTDEVLAGLGYDAARIAAMRTAGAVR